jgi:hypothetical protein
MDPTGGGGRLESCMSMSTPAKPASLVGNRYPLCREGKKWASARPHTTSDEAASTTHSSLSTNVQLNRRTLGREESAHCSGQEGTFDPASERHKGVDWQR